MVNRNATRHLLFVVSVLLCFIVYMGYRFRGTFESSGNATESAAGALRPGDDSLTSGTVSAPQTSSIPPGIAPPSDTSPIRRESDAGSGSLRPSGLEGVGSLMPPPPSGSIEESRTDNSGDSITGLIPAPPTGSPAVQSPDIPGRDEDPLPGGVALAPPPREGTLKPPGVAVAPPSGNVGSPGGAGASASAGSAGRTGGVLLPPPPSGGSIAPSPAGAGTSAVGADSFRPVAGNVPSARPGTAGGQLSNRPGSLVAPARAGDDTPPVPAGAGGPLPSESLRIYVVQPGDTLSRIAARELGSIALADNIFLLNRDVIPDPNQLMAGARIRLPVVRETGGGAAAGAVAPNSNSIVRPERVHVVARGDTLSSLALRYYGTSAAWRHIFEANKGVLSNPNQLVLGTELVIPPYPESL